MIIDTEKDTAEHHKQLLILDLDETLLYASERPLPRPHDLEIGPYVVYKRPFVEEFIETCSALFEIAVWTTSTEAYAETLTTLLFPPAAAVSFVWARKRCTPSFSPGGDEQSWIKDLKKVKRLGYRLERVIVIDDSPEKHARNYGNLLRVAPYGGDPADEELKLLVPYLKYLATVEDIRKIEKRNWKTFLSERL